MILTSLHFSIPAKREVYSGYQRMNLSYLGQNCKWEIQGLIFCFHLNWGGEGRGVMSSFDWTVASGDWPFNTFPCTYPPIQVFKASISWERVEQRYLLILLPTLKSWNLESIRSPYPRSANLVSVVWECFNGDWTTSAGEKWYLTLSRLPHPSHG